MYILRYTLTPAPPSLQGRACTPLPVFFSCFVLFILVRFITADPVPDRRVVCTHLIGKPFEYDRILPGNQKSTLCPYSALNSSWSMNHGVPNKSSLSKVCARGALGFVR